MKNIWQVIGVICGLLIFLFETYWFFIWWGLEGVIAGVIFFPLAVLFPFIYFFKEGFSLFYFGIWALGIIGGILGQQDEEQSSKSE